jgi:hypothetical protein
VSAFSVLQTTRTTPPGHVTVPTTAFDDRWDRRPKDAVCMGLRNVAEDDLQTARSEAAKVASRLHPQALSHRDGPSFELWAATYNDALIRWIIARGTCDANDTSRSWEGWRVAPEDMVAIALTTSGAQFIFDAWERMKLSTDITTPEATDEEIAELATKLDGFARLERGRAARARRLLRFVLDELT